jgi:hypothetical protein
MRLGESSEGTIMKRIMIVVLLVVLSNAAMAATIRVPSEYAGIQAAIDASSNGDTILVGSGTYSMVGGYLVNKPLHIISEFGPDSTIIANSPPHCVGCPQVGSNGFWVGSFNGLFTIKGFTMMNHVEGMEIVHSGGWGVHVFKASGTISNNVFKDNESAGVELPLGSSVIVENNFFTGNQMGISINGGSGDIRFNTIVGSTGYGQIDIVLTGTHATINNNIIVNAPGRGIYSDGLGSYQISCNDVWNNAGGNYNGTLSDQTGTNGNISVDPLFCGVAGSGNFYLQSSSPCAEQNVPSACSGQGMGCYPATCTVATAKQSWGSIKSLFDSQKK